MAGLTALPDLLLLDWATSLVGLGSTTRLGLEHTTSTGMTALGLGSYSTCSWLTGKRGRDRNLARLKILLLSVEHLVVWTKL